MLMIAPLAFTPVASYIRNNVYIIHNIWTSTFRFNKNNGKMT
jgi:hypothetical protein